MGQVGSFGGASPPIYPKDLLVLQQSKIKDTSSLHTYVALERFKEFSHTKK